MGIFRRHPREMDPQGNPIDRRKAQRLHPSALPSLKSVRLVPGSEIRLINVSSGGALLESDNRILPGANICIRLVAEDVLYFLRGRVLQSRASSIRGSALTYECRVAFDEEFSLLSSNADKQQVTAEPVEPAPNQDADSSHESWPAVVEEGTDSHLMITVPIPHLECDLRQVFGL
jgi:hypothetical protein